MHWLSDLAEAQSGKTALNVTEVSDVEDNAAAAIPAEDVEQPIEQPISQR